MNKKFVFLILVLFFVLLHPGRTEAALPTFDAVNAALNELRNALMQSQFAQDIALALERLRQLQATYQELLRFHAGLDDFFEVVIGDPFREVLRWGRSRVRDAFRDVGRFTPQIEIWQGSSEPQDIRYALEQITGEIPESGARPWIPFEEMQVVEGFQTAQEIRGAGQSTRDAAQAIADQAKSASPKGAARLGVEAQAQLIQLSQQNQEALAKLIELEATQVEQVSREEKRYERERLRYMERFLEGLETLGRVN